MNTMKNLIILLLLTALVVQSVRVRKEPREVCLKEKVERIETDTENLIKRYENMQITLDSINKQYR